MHKPIMTLKEIMDAEQPSEEAVRASDRLGQIRMSTKTKNKRQHTAILTAYGMDRPGMAVYMAKWLRKQASNILKEVRRQNKGKAKGFSNRFTARLTS